MAEHSDHTPSAWDAPPPPPLPAAGQLRPIGGRPARFGVANELERMQRGDLSPARNAARKVPRDHVGGWERARTWWACRDSGPSDVWRRVQCRRGHHDIQGGQRIQIGGRFVNSERCCVWCGARPTG